MTRQIRIGEIGTFLLLSILFFLISGYYVTLETSSLYPAIKVTAVLARFSDGIFTPLSLCGGGGGGEGARGIGVLGRRRPVGRAWAAATSVSLQSRYAN